MDTIDYTPEEMDAAKALMAIGPGSTDEFFAKLHELGFSLKRESGGEMPSDEPPTDEPPEPPSEEIEETEELNHGGPAGLAIMLPGLRKSAAKKAMSKHGY